MNHAKNSRQRGLTLVELMIAMVLGVLLIGGVIQIFLSGQQSYRLQKGLGLIQDSGRTAIFFLHRGLRIAGLPREGRPGIQQPFIIANDDSGRPATRNGDDDINEPDVITVMYQSTTNCLGDDTSAYPLASRMQDAFGNFYAKDQYYIGTSTVGTAQSVRNPLSLRCRALGLDNLQVTTRTAALVDGVEDFQILYGVDLLPAPPGVRDFQPERYMNATAVTAAGAWNFVTSVRFAVLANSLDSALDTASPDRLRLLDAPAHAAYSDRLLRRVFRSTVEVRNQTP